MAFYVYILSNEDNSKFIVGFTNNLVRNIHEMRNSQAGVISRLQINKLVYFESHHDYNEAKRREREIIGWEDGYMKGIISLQNGRFNDLYEKIF